ncbi:MAG: metallophosphoesterase [Candidatus Bathyarchaeota archaeon]|nr:MAG: metallophosphoesterase [Candidatus Bathyarchaeota archaeon]
MIGIISDTHDNISMIDKAVKKLNEREVRLILHAGDYISPFTVKRFKPLNAQVIGVFGNNCAERNVLKKLFSKIGGDLRGFFAEIKIEGLKIALLHGHNEELLHSLVDSKAYDLVAHGHTHRQNVQRKDKTLVINPGEVCGYLSGESTLAIVNLNTRNVEILHL